MNIYIMKCTSNAEEYIKIQGSIAHMRIPILRSEVHKLTKEKVIFDISEDGGLEVPDLICYEGIPLVSDRVKELMDRNDSDYLFWKEADLQSKRYGINEKFWILVPPRIDCVDVDRSEINFADWDYLDGIIPMFEYKSIHLVPKMLGRFEMFKILGILDNNIYVTENIYEQMQSQNYTGVAFMKLQ